MPFLTKFLKLNAYSVLSEYCWKCIISCFLGTFEYWKNSLEKCIMLLRKYIMCYECIDSWDIWNEKSLLSKEYVFSELNNKGIKDWRYVQRISKKLNTNKKNIKICLKSWCAFIMRCFQKFQIYA